MCAFAVRARCRAARRPPRSSSLPRSARRPAAGEARWNRVPRQRVEHGADATSDAAGWLSNGCPIRRRYALRPPARSSPRDRVGSPLAELLGVECPDTGRRSSSSRRWVRIISGPSVAIVNGTPCSTKARTCLAARHSSASASVSRFERRADLEDRAGLASSRISSGSRAQNAVADAVGPKGLDHLSGLFDSSRPPSSPTWIVTPSRRRAPLRRAARSHGTGAATSRTGSRDVDADDPRGAQPIAFSRMTEFCLA